MPQFFRKSTSIWLFSAKICQKQILIDLSDKHANSKRCDFVNKYFIPKITIFELKSEYCPIRFHKVAIRVKVCDYITGNNYQYLG